MIFTEKEIEELYKFTRTHYVEYYDVQMELVDHLANDIEQICVENPNLTFEEAKKISFKKFGVFGFMNVLEAHQNALSKKYRKILISLMKEWFQLPKLILTLFLMIVVYVFLNMRLSNTVFYSVAFVYLIYVGFRVFYWAYKYRKKQQKINQKWLLESYLFGAGGTGFFVVQLLYNTLFFVDLNFANTSAKIVYSIGVVLTLLIFHIVLEVLPNRADEILKTACKGYNFKKIG